MNLGSEHSVAQVGFRDDVFSGDRLEEARPAGSRIELGIRAKQRESAAHARVEAGLVIVVENSAERTFRSLGSSDFVLLGCQLRAPLLLALDHAWDFERIGQGAVGLQEANSDIFRRMIHGLRLFGGETSPAGQSDENRDDHNGEDKRLDDKRLHNVLAKIAFTE
jgi:hypothetical protein